MRRTVVPIIDRCLRWPDPQDAPWADVNAVQSVFPNVRRVIMIGGKPWGWQNTFTWPGYGPELGGTLRRAFGRDDLVVEDEQGNEVQDSGSAMQWGSIQVVVHSAECYEGSKNVI